MALGFRAGFTGAPLVPRSPRPHRQLIVVRASRLHGAGLEGRERSDGPLCRPEAYTTREIPSPDPSLRWLRWLFGVTESGSESLSGSESNQINELRSDELARRGYTVREAPAETSWWESIPMPIAIPTPRRKEAEQQLAADAPKGAPLKHGVGLSSRVHRRATRPAVPAAASAVDCGAGVPPARGWVGGERAVRWTAMQAGGLHHKRDSLPRRKSRQHFSGRAKSARRWHGVGLF